MKRLIVLSLLAALSACGDKNGAGGNNGTATAAKVDAPAGTDWTTTVTKTADGGFLMGNPNAKVKLVEYLSLTCSHCAEFAKTGFAPIRDKYVAKGTVSFEVRNYVRDAIDVTAALITRCNGSGPFFALTEQALANQDAVFERAQKVTPADQQRIGALPPAEQYSALAGVFGLDQFARQRGVGEAKLKTCLADKATLDELVAMQKYANETIKLEGTPTFIINGKTLENTGTWEQLEPQLTAAGA